MINILFRAEKPALGILIGATFGSFFHSYEGEVIDPMGQWSFTLVGTDDLVTVGRVNSSSGNNPYWVELK